MLDTNVLVSTIIFSNSKMDALIRKATLEHQLILSSVIIDELFTVTKRKFPDKLTYVDRFLARLPYELVYSPIEPGFFHIRDINDYPVLYTAIIEDIDLFVTGDGDFDGVEIEKPLIVSPSEFLENF
jgi:putative PIN family toxin of toxin-antitoxin system